MNIQRLKFAWARGARVEKFYADSLTWQINETPLFREDRSYRIHPEDEGLEYGVISRELRRFALHGQTEFRDAGESALALFQVHLPGWFLALDEEGDLQLRSFALFFAEAIADEGL